MNPIGFRTLLGSELLRIRRIIGQALIAPVISTLLYFLVFGTTLGQRISTIDGIPYIQFIVPGLIMMSVLSNSFANTSFSIYLAKFSGSVRDLLAAPLSGLEITSAYTIAAMVRGLINGIVIWIVALLFTDIPVAHPLWIGIFLILVSLTFAVFGFVVGVWAKDFNAVGFLPTFAITPLSFLGGIFYSTKQLPEFWQHVSLANPVLYMINGLRYGFFGIADTNPTISLIIILVLLVAFTSVAAWMLRTGYKLRT